MTESDRKALSAESDSVPIVDDVMHQALIIAYQLAREVNDPPQTMGEAHLLAQSIGRMFKAMRPPVCECDGDIGGELNR